MTDDIGTCEAISHTVPATTVVRFNGNSDGRVFFRQFCDRHARAELAKHDDAEVVESEIGPGDILARELGSVEDRDR